MQEKAYDVMFEKKDYSDPTAETAIRNILMSDKKKRLAKHPGQLVYICTKRPIRTEEDFYYIDRCCRFAVEQGVLPIAPLLFYADLYDATESRMQNRILGWTRPWIKNASEIWLFGGDTFAPLQYDFVKSDGLGKTIRYFDENTKGDFLQTHMTRGTKSTKEGEEVFCCAEGQMKQNKLAL